MRAFEKRQLLEEVFGLNSNGALNDNVDISDGGNQRRNIDQIDLTSDSDHRSPS
jgi:hypothetical protein